MHLAITSIFHYTNSILSTDCPSKHLGLIQSDYTTFYFQPTNALHRLLQTVQGPLHLAQPQEQDLHWSVTVATLPANHQEP